MSNKTFCPIRSIGFNPPEEGQRDMRLCDKDCAWFDVSQETCAINIIAEAVVNTEVHTADIMDMQIYNTYESEDDEYVYATGYRT